MVSTQLTIVLLSTVLILICMLFPIFYFKRKGCLKILQMFAGLVAYLMINMLIVPVFSSLVSSFGTTVIAIVRFIVLVLSEIFVTRFLYKVMIKDNEKAKMISAGVGFGFFEVFASTLLTVLLLALYLTAIQNGTIESTLQTMGYTATQIEELVTSLTTMSYWYCLSFIPLAISVMILHITSAYMIYKKAKWFEILPFAVVFYALNIFAPYLGTIGYFVCFAICVIAFAYICLKQPQLLKIDNEGNNNG